MNLALSNAPVRPAPVTWLCLAQRAFRSRVLFTRSAGKGDACSSAGSFTASAGASSSRGVPAGGRPTASKSDLSLGASMHASTPRTVRHATHPHADAGRWRPRRGESTGGRRRDATRRGGHRLPVPAGDRSSQPSLPLATGNGAAPDFNYHTCATPTQFPYSISPSGRTHMRDADPAGQGRKVRR
jgi:hypothetical protein